LNPAPSFSLAGRGALVTGGSKGLGKAMARGLAQAGADVVIVSRHEDELKAALAEILDGTGRRGGYVVADLSQRAETERIAKEALAQLGRIDILVNNAGANVPQRIDEVTDEAWDRVLELHLSSVMGLTRAIVPQMKERHWGRVVHISSVLGFMSREGRNAYSAAKSALAGLARASAIDLGPFGITVNCIAPGAFATVMSDRGAGTDDERRAMTDRTALGRWGEPTELVGPLLLLASDAGSYVTGTTLIVDGGWLAR
jgi:NAD(P)-dependent dehydrogenase (short-subunit alcohol dehydrogenase family)